MIRRVWSDLPDFREAIFEPGMNVVLADQGEDSEETESTNGLGKTTLLRIIHFALGSDLARDRVLSHPDLLGATFGIDIKIDGVLITVSRSTATPKRVKVTRAVVEVAPASFEESDDGDAIIDLEDWRALLSEKLTPESVVRDGNVATFVPSFREIAYYFMRVGKEAFADPLLSFAGQSGPAKRTALTFLLDLNLNVQRALQGKLEERDRVSKALKALKEANSEVEQESIGDLEAQRVVLEKQLSDRSREIEGFNLRSDYHDLEDRLDRSDRGLHDLINDNHSDRRLLEYYEQSAATMPAVTAGLPSAILADAGALFRAEALRTLQEVADFHEQVHRNRATFLANEIQRLRMQIKERGRRIDDASTEKSSLLKILSASGALETLVDLQRSSTDLRVALEGIKRRIEERKKFDRRWDDLTAEIGQSRKLLKQDLDDRREGVDEAISLFAEYTRALYGVAGKLAVDVQDHGYRCTFAVDRQGSDGVDQMVVFCFDLTVATLRARRGRKFLTLIHDSSLFADVDPRQYGLALQLAAAAAAREGFQYICCLNAGALPKGHLGELNLDIVTKLSLSDASDQGRLLGRRLTRRER